MLDTVPLYESGFFKAGSSELMEDAYKLFLVELRPNMVPLAEIIPYENEVTTIGNSFGDIYEQQFETARATPLNQGGPNDLVFDFIKPVQKMKAAVKL